MSDLVSIIRAKLEAPRREVLKAKRRRPYDEMMERARKRGEAALARHEAGGVTLTALGLELGISTERVRQIIAEARTRR